MIKGGYVGKILRVDLTTETIKDEPLPSEDVLRKFIGCLGLGVKFLFDELPRDAKSTDPESPLIIMTGPLTGLPVPGSSSWTVVNLNFDTKKTVGSAHGHGFFGPYLKFAGYDGIIIKGIAKRPVYLWIHDGMAEIRDASNLWGKDTHETEDLVREELGIKEVSVAAIGPAGENLISGALIESDKHHHAAKGGCGAVMGSKKLKAIAAFGRGGIPIADGRKLLEISQRWKEALFLPYGTGTMMKNGGITRMYDYFGASCFMAVKNYQNPLLGAELGKNIVEAAKAGKLKITPAPCYNCPIGCSYRSEITYGPYKGKVATLSGGGENVEAASALFGITEPAIAHYLTDLNDRLGLDSSVALAMSLAFECYEKGILKKEDTDGLELRWGDHEVVMKLLDKVIKREGFGAKLADGPGRAAEHIGGDAHKYVVHIKGTGINLHDWRTTWSVLLGQAVAGAGPRFEGLGVDFLVIEPDLGYSQPGTPFVKEGKAKAVRETGNKKLWEDCLGVCMFTSGGVPGSLTFIPEALMCATGWEGFTKEEALLVGERVVNLERVFNIQRGLTPADDLNVSQRLLEAPTEGVAQGKAIGPYFKEMVMEYYELMGWDKDTGKPFRETLEKVGLGDLSSTIWGG